MINQIKCPISGKPMKPVFSETILRKYEVTFYYCEESGLLKSESPYWLNEAYQEAISDLDTGLVQRNISNSNISELIIICLGIGEGKILDMAGGYGLLTRLMRDKGFDCYSIDKYCQNIFAKSFEPGKIFKADALLAFEVLEHLEDPLEFLNTAFTKYSCNTLIFSTLTFSNEIPSKDWWYYAFEGGQHITFYQPRTLSLLAEYLNCKYYMVNPNLHLFTDIGLSKSKRIILFNKSIRKLYSYHVRRKRKGFSKTWTDYLKMKEYLKIEKP